MTDGAVNGSDMQPLDLDTSGTDVRGFVRLLKQHSTFCSRWVFLGKESVELRTVKGVRV